MTGFLIGVLSGAVVGGAASFAKNPLSGQPLRNDVRETVDNFTDSCHRVKNIYSELSEKNKEDDTKKSKVKVFTDAFTAASFKALDHEKFFAEVKNKFSKTQEPVEISKETDSDNSTAITPENKKADAIDSESGASEHEEPVETKKAEIEKPEEKSTSDSISGASEHEEN